MVARGRTALHSAHTVSGTLAGKLMCYLYTKLAERTLKSHYILFLLAIILRLVAFPESLETLVKIRLCSDAQPYEKGANGHSPFR